MKIKIAFTVLILVFFSCITKNNKDNYFTDIDKLIYESQGVRNIDINKVKHVLIIPNAGCDGCISEAEKILLDHKGNDKVVIVLTTFDSVKSIYLKYGYDIQNFNNIVIDKNSLFIKNGYSSIYPMILDVFKGKLENVYLQNPDDPEAIKRLMIKLKK